MKIFEIHEESQKSAVDKGRIQGYLFYYEKSRRFYIELVSSLDKWSAPALFYGHMKRKQYFVDSEWSMRWVRQRIIPAERQNISAILRDNGLKSYDEYKLLELSQGRCAQDDSYIVKITEDKLPKEIKDRLARKVRDVLTMSGHRVLVFFKDNSSKIVNIQKLLKDTDIFSNVLASDEVYNSVKVSPGGNGIEWDEDRSIPAEILHKKGTSSLISYEDIIGFAERRLADTSEISETLGVSRQYIDQLVRQNKLHPVNHGAGIRFFAKAETEIG